MHSLATNAQAAAAAQAAAVAGVANQQMGGTGRSELQRSPALVEINLVSSSQVSQLLLASVWTICVACAYCD